MRGFLTRLGTLLTKPAPRVGSPVSDAAERRHTTVLFADLVGSTEIATSHDPEAVSVVLRAYRDAVSQEISAAGGYVAKYMGDGVIAYFGWPHAQEDAAERSIRAGLGIARAVQELKDDAGQSLHARVGVASGLVVIGETIGEGAAREQTVVGEAPNLAARLQALADPDCVLVSDATHRLIGAMFECEDAGAKEFKGFKASQRVWRILRAADVASRFAGAARGRGDFIGRERELERLCAAWEGAASASGQALWLIGEPGIGKSRLVDVFGARAAAHDHNSMLWQCSELHGNNALYPVVRCMEQAAGVSTSAPASTNAERLRSYLSDQWPQDSDGRRLVSDLLGLAPLPGASPLALAPAQRKPALIGALTNWITLMAERQRLLLIVEDTHWIDPTTEELLARVVAGITSTRILALITSRPAATISTHGDICEIKLDRLDASVCHRVVESVSGQSLEPALIDKIVAKSDGNPLFLEELTRAVLDFSLTGRQAVPDTLQDSLMARLDRLGDAKESAQIAAVIGRRFARPLLAAVANRSRTELDADLAALMAAQLAYPTGAETEQTFEFKHALVRDAAYESLLLAKRRHLHGSVADAIEASFTSLTEEEPELVGHHFERAERPERAAFYYQRAGDRSAGRFAFQEAIAGYRAALAQLALLPSANARDLAEVDVRLKLGPALQHILGVQHPDVRAAYEPAALLAKKLGDIDRTFKATWGLWFQANISRDFGGAREWANELVMISERSQESDQLLEAAHCLWSTAQFRGEYKVAREQTRYGMDHYDPSRHHALGLIYGGHDPGVCAYACHANTLALDGIGNDASTFSDKAISLGETLGHPPSLVHALTNTLIVYPILRDYARVRQNAVRLLDLCHKHNIPPQGAVASFISGWVDAAEGNENGFARMNDVFQRVTSLGPIPIYCTGLLGDQLARAGRWQDALSLADNALAAYGPEIGMYLSEIHRVRGEALLGLDRSNAPQARSAMSTAAELAHRQGARLLELRAMISLAHASDSPEQAEVVSVLRSLITTFDRNESGRDLAEARVLVG
jgi:class 3 adenylate cyclase/tetratricopeptide (TPR) repeat protein